MDKYSKKIYLKNYRLLNNTILYNKDRKVEPDNLIMLYNYNNFGEIKFEIAEIINKKTGEYIILKSGESRKLFPFEGKSKDNKIFFEDVERNDNIVYVKVLHFDSPRESKMYKINELKHKMPHNEKSEVLCFTNLCFGEYGKTQKGYSFYYIDTNKYFEYETSITDWLKFEQDFNKIYHHFRYTGKNYLQEDEEKVLKDLKQAKLEQDKSVKKFEKKFKIKNLEGRIEESIYK